MSPLIEIRPATQSEIGSVNWEKKRGDGGGGNVSDLSLLDEAEKIVEALKETGTVTLNFEGPEAYREVRDKRASLQSYFRRVFKVGLVTRIDDSRYDITHVKLLVRLAGKKEE